MDESHESEASEALTMLPQKDLASSLIWSVLFRSGYELLSERHEKGYKSSTVCLLLSLGKIVDQMQFVETMERTSRSPLELKFVRYFSG